VNKLILNAQGSQLSFYVAGGRIGTLKFDWSNADGYSVGGEFRV
jgi:hypothetical protein